MSEWLDSAAKGKVSARTLHDYRGFVKLHRACAGPAPLGELSPLHIQAVYTEMQERGLSARTVRNAHAVLRSALNQAVRWRMFPGNPATLVSLPADAAKLRSIEPLAKAVLDARGTHAGESLAALYDPDTMPTNLRKTHLALDRAVDTLYRKRGFASDRERAEHLFGLYEAMVAPLVRGRASRRKRVPR